MILGVMSDTHGNRRLMHAVAEQMISTHHATVLFHLGDDYEDGEELRCSGYDVRTVPGLWCQAYRNSRIPKTLIEDFDGVTIAAAHADKDLRAPERAAAILLTGHTHAARIDRRGPKIWFNPGHLKSDVNRGQRASYGIITLTSQAIHLAIFEAQGLLREEARFSKAAGA